MNDTQITPPGSEAPLTALLDTLVNELVRLPQLSDAAVERLKKAHAEYRAAKAPPAVSTHELPT